MYAKIMNRRIQKMIDGKRRETHSCWNRSTGKKRKRRMKEQKWNDDKKQAIICVVAFIVALIWLAYTITHPVTYTDLPLEKRIQYEKMIFP